MEMVEEERWNDRDTIDGVFFFFFKTRSLENRGLEIR